MTLPLLKSEDPFLLRLEEERLAIVHEVAQRNITHYGEGAELQSKADAISWVMASYNHEYDELMGQPNWVSFQAKIEEVIDWYGPGENSRKEGYQFARDLLDELGQK